MCDVVWSNCTTTEAKCLDTLFNYGCLVLHNHRLYSAPSARQGLQFTTSSDRRKFHVSNNVQVFKLSGSTVPDTSFWHSINPPQHTCISHKTTELPCNTFLFGQTVFSFAGAMAWWSLPSNVRVWLSYFLQTIQYMTYFSFPWKLLHEPSVYFSAFSHVLITIYNY